MLRNTLRNTIVLLLLCLITKPTLGQKIQGRADSIITITSKEIILTNSKSKRVDVLIKLTVNNQGKVIKADPMLKVTTDLDKTITEAAKNEALKLVFDKRKKNYPDEIQFVKITYLTKFR